MTDQLVLHSFYRTRTVCVKSFVRPAATRQSRGGERAGGFSAPRLHNTKSPHPPVNKEGGGKVFPAQLNGYPRKWG